MPTPGSRSGSRGEGQGYPRPNPNRTPSSNMPNRYSNEGDYNRPPRPAPAPVASPPAPTASVSAKGFLTDEVRELIQLMAASDLTEINIEMGSQKLLLRREPARIVMPEPATVRGSRNNRQASQPPMADTPPIPDPGSPPEDAFHKITAPMVGTFYRSSDPKTKPFVQEGDMVEKGQVIGIIEAMKIMNEIQSEHGGRCLRVVVENGQPVEYGQALLVLEPA